MKQIKYEIKHVNRGNAVFWEILDKSDLQYCKNYLSKIQKDYANCRNFGVAEEEKYLSTPTLKIRHRKTHQDITEPGPNSIMTFANGVLENFKEAKKTDFTNKQAENLEDVSDLLHSRYPAEYEQIRFVRAQYTPSGNNSTFLDIFGPV